MSELDKVLKVSPGLRGIARSNTSGNIEEFTGQLDAESVCAVAAMCAQHLKRIEELLGCGEFTSWALTTENTGFYVHHGRDGLIAIVGEACVLPGALSPRALWSLVVQGRSALSRVPAGGGGVGLHANMITPRGLKRAKSRRLRAGRPRPATR